MDNKNNEKDFDFKENRDRDKTFGTISDFRKVIIVILSKTRNINLEIYNLS
ncbi:MAG: hypothetical protein ACXVC6_01690 [Bacteroidia bacterium]